MKYAVALLALVACDPLVNPNYPPPDPLPSDLTTCEAPSDCVIVELGCCDYCNGGTAVAVRADKESEVVDTYAQTCENLDLACTEMACAQLQPACVENTCVAVSDEM